MATLNLGRVRMVFKGEFSTLNGSTLEFFDAVTYGGSLYVVTATSVVVDDSDSGNRPPTVNGQTSFLQITTGVQFVGQWSDGGPNSTSDLIYYENQIVKYGPNTFIALTEVPTGRPNPLVDYNNDAGYWQILAKGFGNYVPDFDSTQNLDPGDMVTYDGTLWLAVDVVSPGENPDTNPDKFDRLDGRLDPKGQWTANTLYELSDTVVFHGSTYVVTAETTNNIPVNADGSINSSWELLVQGFDWVGEYNPTSYEGYYKGDILVYQGSTYVVLERVAFQQNPANTAYKFQLLLSGDSIRESDFNTDGFIVRQNAVITVDTNTYLQENQDITISGDVTGTGKTAITTSLTVDAVINQTTATELETNGANTSFLGAIDVGNGVFELRKFDPSNVRPDLPADFSPTEGIERVSSDTGPVVTLGVNDKIIANLDDITETNLLPDIASGDEFMVRDFANERLYAISYQQLVNKLNTQITGNAVDGVTNFRAMIDTPSSYNTFGGAYLRVNEAENAIEFAEDDIFLQILAFG